MQIKADDKLASNVSETQMMLAKLKRYEDTMDAMQIKADNMQEVHDEKDAELRKCGAENQVVREKLHEAFFYNASNYFNL